MHQDKIHRTTVFAAYAALGLAVVAMGTAAAAAVRGTPAANSTQGGTTTDPEPATGTLPSPATPKTGISRLPETTLSASPDESASPTGPERPAAVAAGLTLSRLVVTTGIERREPVPSPVLTTAGPTVAFIEIGNDAPEATKILVTFERAGAAPVGNVWLDVPGGQRRYRTWARSGLVKIPGSWVAVVRSESGRELGRQEFTVQPTGEPQP